jgi:phenylalanyl-tRNA synthetase beta chain
MNTDSSYRFERFVYPPYAQNAALEAGALICELSGGTFAAETVMGVLPVLPSASVEIDAKALCAYVGTEITTAEIAAILTRLSCEVTENGEKISVRVPAYRRDLRIAQDIYEEVIRIYGFDKIPAKLPVILAKDFGDGRYELKCSLRRKLISLGFKEAITFNIVDNAHPLRAPEKQPVIIANPLKAPENELRTSVYQTLVDSVAHNVRQKRRDIHLFEFAHIFEMDGDAAKEQEVIGFVSHAETRDELPIFKAKVEEFVRSAGLADAERAPAQHAHFAVCEKFVKDGVLCGCYGIMTREKADAMDVKEVFIAGFFADALLRFKKRPTYAKINYLPSTSRDISVLATGDVAYATIEKTVREHVGELLVDLEVVDTYRGKNIPAGTTAFTLRVTYQHAEKTLENEEVDAMQFALRDKLAGCSGVTLR